MISFRFKVRAFCCSQNFYSFYWNGQACSRVPVLRRHDERRSVSVVDDVELDVASRDEIARDVVTSVSDRFDQRVFAVTTLQRNFFLL